ncbi:MAG: hypothetical protein KDB61_15140, partial [Planctomycetes bacterium]|nr:hypothetical protein [Planctomycetota bacterium]
PGNTGTFTITPDLPIVNPNNGHSYKVVNVNTDWQTARADAEAMMFNNLPGHLVTFSDQAEVDWVLNNLPIGRPWIGLYQNTTSATFAEPSGGWEWVTGEPFSFVNWAAGEPNNISGSGGAEDYAEMFGSGEWNDCELFHTATSSYIVEWDGMGLGVPFCNPMNINSTGQSTNLAVSNSTGSPTGIHLEATQGPPNQFGFFLVGTGVSDPGVPVSQGRLCLSSIGGNNFAGYKTGTGALNSIGRFDAMGVMQNLPGSSTTGTGFDVPSTLPFAGSPMIMAGETWNFQVWHREDGGQSNFSNGLSVTF